MVPGDIVHLPHDGSSAYCKGSYAVVKRVDERGDVTIVLAEDGEARGFRDSVDGQERCFTMPKRHIEKYLLPSSLMEVPPGVLIVWPFGMAGSAEDLYEVDE